MIFVLLDHCISASGVNISIHLSLGIPLYFPTYGSHIVTAFVHFVGPIRINYFSQLHFVFEARSIVSRGLETQRNSSFKILSDIDMAYIILCVFL